MPDDFVFYISHYGYLAIFLLVFLQEIGAPTPLPNELALIFSGYLIFTGVLQVPLIVLTVFTADILAATVLYISFYFFGNLILSKHPKWLPISKPTIERQIERFNKRGISSICISRLSPFIRGYAAVICGLMHFSPRKYTIIILCTSFLWSIFYITIGYFSGPYWNYIQAHVSQLEYILIIIPIAFILWFSGRLIGKEIMKRRNSEIVR